MSGIFYKIGIVRFLLGLFGKSWPKACKKIEAAMITPLLVYNNKKQVERQTKELKSSKFYNAVCSLVDLQEGRNYIFMGRSSIKLDKKCEENIQTVLNGGITPILIIRNDWAIRNKWKQRIPSVGGPAPSNEKVFYGNDYLEQEKKFLKSLEKFFEYIHIQLNIEPNAPESAQFALKLAEYLRSIGFKNYIIVNPYNSAVAAHSKIKAQLDKHGVMWARSHRGMNPSPDPIWNSDGDTNINDNNAKVYLDKMKKSGKHYILWSQKLANCPDGIPEGYR